MKEYHFCMKECVNVLQSENNCVIFYKKYLHNMSLKFHPTKFSDQCINSIFLIIYMAATNDRFSKIFQDEMYEMFK